MSPLGWVIAFILCGCVVLAYFWIGEKVVAPWYARRADEVYATNHAGIHLELNVLHVVKEGVAIMWFILLPAALITHFKKWRNFDVHSYMIPW